MAQSPRPLETVLDRDGAIRSGGGSGAFDPRGWNMSVAPDGEPRFSRESSGSAAGAWSNDIGIPGVDHVGIYAMVLDGEKLYVGGNFTQVAGVDAPFIAVWNRSTREWSPVGKGMDYPVRALTLYKGKLVAAGEFRRAGDDGPSGIATWDGTEWLKIGSGIDGRVLAVEVVGDDLYAGGDFTMAGDVEVRGLARWDGAGWSEVGGGITGVVYALEHVDDTLYVGGDISQVGLLPVYNIARYSGGAWDTLGAGVSSAVYALGASQGRLYAGGDFFYAGTSTTLFIAQWTGSEWLPVGNGLTFDVTTIVPTEEGIYAGGTFAGEIGNLSEGIARWDGTQWLPVPGLEGTVHALAPTTTGVIVGGDIVRAGGNDVGSVAELKLGEWSGLADGPSLGFYSTIVNAVAVHGEEVIVGGRFTRAGDRPAGFVASWNMVTGEWSDLGGGVNAYVQGLTVTGDSLLVCGQFTRAGESLAYHAAVYDFKTGGWSPIGRGLYWNVLDLAMMDGSVHAASYGVYRVDGIDWTLLGGGINGFVQTILPRNDSLFAGGTFTRAGSNALSGLACLVGAEWFGVGGGTNGTILDMADQNGTLIVGGYFTRAGTTSASNIAAWNGSSWRALGTGTDDFVTTIEVDGNDLYVGGGFSMAGGAGADYVARWSNGVWNPLDPGGPDWTVFGSAISGEGVYFGGRFQEAGNDGVGALTEWVLRPSGVVERPDAGERSLRSSAFPNPSSGDAAIRFTLPQPADIELDLVDAHGATALHISKKSMPMGDQEILLDGAGLADGTYHYRLRAGGETTAGSIVIVR
jgi:hypothetical protein